MVVRKTSAFTVSTIIRGACANESRKAQGEQRIHSPSPRSCGAQITGEIAPLSRRGSVEKSPVEGSYPFETVSVGFDTVVGGPLPSYDGDAASLSVLAKAR